MTRKCAAKEPCSDTECERPAIARGFCAKHYQRWRKANGLTPVTRSAAVWYCDDCFDYQRPGSFACSLCCGFTGKRDKVATGVTDAFGQPSRRVPS